MRLLRTVCVLAITLCLAAPAAWGQGAARLDTSSFVVLGEGLAAGMANYGLSRLVQEKSFPAQMARQMQTAYAAPLMDPPGIGHLLGYQMLPVRVPYYPQTRVRVFPAKTDPNDETPTLFVTNLSVPNLKLEESLNRRPVSPLVHDNDLHQTVINLILGFPAMILDRQVPLWTQFEYARNMRPSIALVELGYYEALEAAVALDPARVPDPAAFRGPYETIVKGLRAQFAEVIVTTIPDPVLTAYFNTPAEAARLMGVAESELRARYNVATGDLIARDALQTIGNNFMRGRHDALPAGSVLRSGTAAALSARVAALNEEIKRIAGENRAVVHDLGAFFRNIRSSAVTVGSRTITGSYLGGFYSLDGFYPGVTGHALIANDILGLLNRTYASSFPLVNVAAAAGSDPAVEFLPASRPALEALPIPAVPLSGSERRASDGPPGSADPPATRRSPRGRREILQ